VAETAQNFEVSELSVDARIGLDLKDEKKLRVNLESEDDALFVGTLYVGAPHSQPVKVIFDTGSEHLAITSALCNNHSAGNYHFARESKFSKTMQLEWVTPPTKSDKKKEPEPDEYIDVDLGLLPPESLTNVQESAESEETVGSDDIYDEDLDSASQSPAALAKEFKDKNEESKKKHKNKKVRENRCRSQAYNMHNSTSGTVLSNKSMSLSYGSAKLTGFLWKDYSCLQPLNLNAKQTNLTNATFLAKVTD